MESTSNPAGRLIVKIAGLPFYVDHENQRYVDRRLPQNIIRDDDLRRIYDAGAQGVLFDKRTRNIFDSPLDNGKLPASVIPFYIPLTSQIPLKVSIEIYRHSIAEGAKRIRGKDLDNEMGGQSL